ncbi:MAG: homocysteine S-methyltransferase family protein [Clostridia bacterium]|nr:homocysteine S-methyltransferase family protein [Clostridia bacterium]
MNILEFIKQKILVFDGATGTVLQESDLKPGQSTEAWNISYPEHMVNLHRMYFDAGANAVLANTFGVNPLKYSKDETEGLVVAAMRNAKKAAMLSRGRQEKFIGLDVGPTGRLLRPLGDLDFEEAVAAFSLVISSGAHCGADFIFIETMNDLYETKAALLAAKESCDLPVFVSNAYSDNGKLMTGSSPETVVAVLEGMGADVIGVNCSSGPEALFPVLKKYISLSSVPVLFKPNAGLPRIEDGKTVYGLSVRDFSESMKKALDIGVSAVGGCCGTTPEYINAVSGLAGKYSPPVVKVKQDTVVASGTKSVFLGKGPIVVGERINPTGKPKIREALRMGNIGYILEEAVAQQDCGAHILDVNAGLPDVDESALLPEIISELQTVTDLPLQIDTSDPLAMEKSLRVYNGKAVVNSVDGKKERMDAVFPLVKKYGGLVVCLTLDENGIPETAHGRVEIAEKIKDCAVSYGLSPKNLIFDTLTMTVTASPEAASVTLDAAEELNRRGYRTVLGISNVSFGLPERDNLNSAFLIQALDRGLSAAIINPCSDAVMKAFRSFRALNGLDADFGGYISSYGNESVRLGNVEITDLKKAIVSGARETAERLASEMLDNVPPLDVINEYVMPALNFVGEGYEKGTLYLPQLLMSAEAASAVFMKVEEKYRKNGEKRTKTAVFVIATVLGDIHDIGKNIVKLLLDNYGFDVIDLGKDVTPERIADEVVKKKASFCGLSALMTTTVRSMEETIKLIRQKAPWCRIVVGGAVLNEEYAAKIGADKYARDAMDTVRFCQNCVISGNND